MFCEWKSAAAKRYQWTLGFEMLAYLLIMFGVQEFVHHHHPGNATIFLLAALPSIPIIGVLVAVGIYLRDEPDEYQRVLTVKSILWGTAGVLAFSAFLSFLHSFGWVGNVPPFTEFVLFWLLMGCASIYYKLTNRPGADV